MIVFKIFSSLCIDFIFCKLHFPVLGGFICVFVYISFLLETFLKYLVFLICLLIFKSGLLIP